MSPSHLAVSVTLGEMGSRRKTLSRRVTCLNAIQDNSGHCVENRLQGASTEQKAQSKAIEIIQGRGGDLDQDGSSVHGKWLDLVYGLQVKPTGFAHKLDVRCKREGGI